MVFSLSSDISEGAGLCSSCVKLYLKMSIYLQSNRIHCIQKVLIIEGQKFGSYKYVETSESHIDVFCSSSCKV